MEYIGELSVFGLPERSGFVTENFFELQAGMIIS